MVKSEEPLNEVSLNTNDFNISRVHKLGALDLDLTGKSILGVLDEDFLVPSDPESQLRCITDFVERDVNAFNEGQLRIVHLCLRNVYCHYIQKHSIRQINHVAKYHLKVIAKCIKIKNFGHAGAEAIALYNSTNPYKVHDLGGILLADRTICNESYLTSLKILTMEIIIKNSQFDRYDKSVIRLFSYDTRYLLNDTSIKIHIVVKLLLNFFSMTTKYKVLFGLKFLQYINQFKLDFGTYIKNMDLGTFSRQLTVYASREPGAIPYLNSFYLAYSKQYHFFDKIMLDDLLVKHVREIPKLKTIDDIYCISERRIQFQCLSITSMDNFISLFELFFDADKRNNNNNSNHDKSTLKKLQALCEIWRVILAENFGADKRQLRLLDKTLIFVNDNLMALRENPDQILQLLLCLIDYCLLNEEPKRISNIVNILINGATLLKDYEFVRLCCKTEITRHLIAQSSFSIENHGISGMFFVFEKLLSLSLEPPERLDIFSQFFSIYTMFHVQEFGTLLDYCQRMSVSCLRKLGLKSYHNFSSSSEVMMSILYSTCKDVNNLPFHHWSAITSMLYGCLSGKIDTGKPAATVKTESYHFLSRSETLIKVVYYFDLEMGKHSVLNLSRITKTYSEKCIKKLSPSDGKMSVLERDFFVSLLRYLEFNNFHRLLIELVETIKSHPTYFQPVWADSQRWLLSAYINLELEDHIKDFIDEFNAQFSGTKDMSLEQQLTVLHTKLELLSYFEDTMGFESLFINTLPSDRKELFDINNTTKSSPSQYIKVLIFNIKLFNVSSRLHFVANDIKGAVSEGKKALKLAMSLIKKQSALSQTSRLDLIKSLLQSYINMINIYVQIGISVDANFYSRELSRIIASLGEPIMVFEALYFCHEFYSLTEQSSLETLVLEKLIKAYKYLDEKEDIISSLKYLFVKGEHNKLLDLVSSHFDERYSDSLLPIHWRLNLGECIDPLMCPSRYKTINLINLTESTYNRALTQLQHDPFFKGLLESTLAIPSCTNDTTATQKGSLSKRIVGVTNSSPRSSNMTPKSKHLKQKFDEMVTIENLSRVVRMIEEFEVTKLGYSELLKLSSFYMSCYSMLSNIATELKNGLPQCVYLADLLRHLPLYFGKVLSQVSLKSLRDFTLLPIEPIGGIMVETDKLCNLQRSIHGKDDGYENIFNVISIDICPITGNLILVKYDGYRMERECLTVPLDSRSSNNSSTVNMNFHRAFDELQSIINESNNSTSIEVTSKIKTAGQRREWWEKRYSLDDRLRVLLESIEKSWFNGLKGFFSDEIIDPQVLLEFKDGFNGILHQNLPSRRRVGNSSMFLQLPDWVVELFLKLDPQEEDFISMMEDLIYFVLDILQYHGEENAYDEIDLSMLHIQLEEIIKKYRSKNCKTLGPRKVAYTFLIVGSKCHLFPWESLSFMRGISTTRIPSLAFLDNLLEKNKGEYLLKTPLRENISMVLNPNGDLERTEERFVGLFKGITDLVPKSRLVVGERPSEELFLDMMSNSSLFVYVGHGGGEQFVRANEIKKLDGIAPSLLLGCSSAAIKYHGNLSPSGMIYSYLQGGSPLVIGNLWDVTDKDIDKFSLSLFEKLGLVGMVAVTDEDNDEFMSASEAIDKSRDSCHLKYLNGAAPVAYGLPISFF